MELKSDARKFVQNPRMLLSKLNTLGCFRGLSDKTCMELLWWARTGKKLDWEHPRGFNEKMQWLKLYDRRPEYTQFVDKYGVRDYVRSTVGEEYLIPLLGVWDSAEAIDFDSLPEQFVLKCTHNSGEGMCICRDKAGLDIPEVRRRLARALAENYYFAAREWPYKDIVPRVIAEPFIVDRDPANTAGTLVDYKFHCFNGEPRFLYVGVDDISDGTKGDLKLSFFDMDWQTPPFFRTDHEPIPLAVKKPEKFDEMVQLARELSRGVPFLRVDLYWVNQQILFSELTMFPGGGYGFFSPEEWERRLGDWITLPDKPKP